MSLILGINAYHADSAACILKAGKLIAAAEEERFRRIKHWAGFPTRAIAYCLNEAGAELSDIDAVAVNRNPRANLLRKIGYAVAHLPSAALLADRIRNAKAWSSIEQSLTDAFAGQRLRCPVHNVEHHSAHLASAFLVSPFDEALVLSVDGLGDFSSACWGVGRGTSIAIEGRVFSPHSLGIFYEAITQYLGFPHYGDEYKVMGLAPYGEPSLAREMDQIVRQQPDGTFRLNMEFFTHGRSMRDFSWSDGAPQSGRLFTPALEELLGPARLPEQEITAHHRNVARSAQATYERAFFSLVNSMYARHPIDRIALAGGCAMNSVANGRLYRNTPVRRVYVQAAAGDAGGAIGAAYLTWHRLRTDAPRFTMNHAYWGSQFSDEEIGQEIRDRGAALEALRCTRELLDEDSLCARTARRIAEGAVVGWFQGRMEWGPRALGNRSIVCDPRRADMKQILNAKIKRRESFRPFAPSVLRSAVREWFETDDDVPFMTQVFQVRADKRGAIPAVTHVDGSGRLQTVEPASNPRYCRLIGEFAKLTGIPILLNTSFNENEPIVCTPGEALDCFTRTGMDVLVLGNWLVERADAPHP